MRPVPLLCASLAVVLTTSGCSFVLVDGPPAGHRQLPFFQCTSSNVVPTLDTALGAVFAAAAAGAAMDSRGSSTDSSDAVLTAAWAVVFLAGGLVGYRRTADCREATTDLIGRYSRNAGRGGDFAPAPTVPYDPWLAPPDFAPGAPAPDAPDDDDDAADRADRRPRPRRPDRAPPRRRTRAPAGARRRRSRNHTETHAMTLPTRRRRARTSSIFRALTFMSQIGRRCHSWMSTRGDAMKNHHLGYPDRLPTPLTRTRVVFAAVGVLAAALAVARPAAAAPRTVVVMPVVGDNVAPHLLPAARELLKDHLQRSGAFSVMEPPPGVAPESLPIEAAPRAAALGAQQAIVLRITHVGNSARVRISAHAAGTGQVLYWDSMLLIGGPDQLDVTIQRLVHAMEIGKPVRDSVEIDTVSAKEQETYARREANRSVGIHLFTLLPVNSASGQFATLPGAGIFWLYDARNWMADIALDLGGQNNSAYYGVSIGGYYPLLREDFTPYIGGTIRWCYMDLDGEGASGMTLQPTAGLLLGRASSVQLRIEAGYFFNTFGERVTPTIETPEPTRNYGNGFTLSVGLGF